MISTLLGIVSWVLQIASFVILIYCIMSLVMPQNALFRKVGVYVEPVLAPFRALLHRIFPKLGNTGLDFSPMLVWLAIDVLIWIIGLLRGILR